MVLHWTARVPSFTSDEISIAIPYDFVFTGWFVGVGDLGSSIGIERKVITTVGAGLAGSYALSGDQLADVASIGTSGKS